MEELPTYVGFFSIKDSGVLQYHHFLLLFESRYVHSINFLEYPPKSNTFSIFSHFAKNIVYLYKW